MSQNQNDPVREFLAGYLTIGLASVFVILSSLAMGPPATLDHSTTDTTVNSLLWEVYALGLGGALILATLVSLGMFMGSAKEDERSLCGFAVADMGLVVAFFAVLGQHEPGNLWAASLFFIGFIAAIAAASTWGVDDSRVPVMNRVVAGYTILAAPLILLSPLSF